MDNKINNNKSGLDPLFQLNNGKSKNNSIEIPSIVLPKGGGAIKGIDEKFSVNAVNGTSSFSIPLPFSSARGASPLLNLSYSSAAGNSIFGLGWQVGLSSIKRKADKLLPQYLDTIDSDIFLFSEAEDLVPEFKKLDDGSFLFDSNNEYIINEKDSPDGLFTIRFYKPRIEGLFARIERWSSKTTSEIKWRIHTKDNSTTLYGWSTASRITDPDDDRRIYEWLPEFVFDDKGNCALYTYKKEDEKGLAVSQLHNNNRIVAGKINYTNLYIEKVFYANIIPYKKFGDALPAESDFLFSTVFDYGEYDLNAPFNKIKDWDFRTDAFSDYKPGFELRTTRLCKRVLLFHHFKGADEYDGLVKSLNFGYDTISQQDFTFLSSITSFGYIKKTDGTYSSKSMPPVEFKYQKHDWNKTVQTVDPAELINAPGGLDEPKYQFTDLFNEGLSGILTEQANGWYYKHNLGGGKFEQAKLITPKPSFIGLGNLLQLADLDADGGKQLVSYGTEPKGYFELDDDNDWHGFRNFKTLPNINFEDSNTRMLDLNGDGKPEVLISDDNVFTWYQSSGRDGFLPARKTVKPFDEEDGAHIVFADEKQTIFLAGMSGSGLTDIVRVRNGDVCYWPNLGYGKFGKKVAMDNAPIFDLPDSFNPAYIKLADIDGSGTTDIIYLGKNKFSCWMNLSGNSFSTIPFEIDPFLDVHDHSKITVTDLLGNGVACIVWSSNLPKYGGASIKYINLMNSKKPHIMAAYKNNLGKEVTLEYTASTKFYIEDKLAGKPWITKLHFPVHCISKMETQDFITGHRFVSYYKYHHGYYDHIEKEFRGFGMVEQTDAEDFDHWVKGNASNIVDATLHQEPVVSKTWFHTGAFLSRDKILNQFAKEYWYEEMNRQGFPVVNKEWELPDAKLVTAPGIDPALAKHLSGEEWQEALRSCKSMVLRSEIFAQDAPFVGATADEIKKQLTPYTVSTHNCIIELLQPKGKNQFAVFVVKESEAITYNYERNIEDPRVAHNLNVQLDEYGNVLESASVVYPRAVADTSVPLETQQAQSKTNISYNLNKFTNDVIGDDVYRLRLPSETKTYELNGVTKIGTFYTVQNFNDILSDANSTTAAYHEIDKPLTPGKAQKRLIEHVRNLYYKEDLVNALPLNQLSFHALMFESYQLAYTPELIADIYGLKVDTALLLEGKFTHTKNEADVEDTNWWVRSGTKQFIEGVETKINAQNRFYTPVSYTDPYGAKTKVTYYGNYFLFVEKTENVLGNISGIDRFNFRTLSPQRMKDVNNNFSEVIIDELGLVKATAIFGKGAEADDLAGLTDFTDPAETALISNFFNAADSVQLTGFGKDLLQHATMRFAYDFFAYVNTGKPAVTASIVREEHFKKNSNAPVQLSFEYSNGLGQIVMKKTQAEPGIAKKVIINIDDTYTITDEDTSTLIPKQLRWTGTGRAVINNKGNAVKQYEPYFSVTHHYEDLKELVETGITPIMYYDAPGRLFKTDLPNGTLSKTEFNSWKQTMYDQNDTVLQSLWYLRRTDNTRTDFITDIKEQQAATKTAKHANTPSTLHLDSLGREVLSVIQNKNITTNADEFYYNRLQLDIERNLRSVYDPRVNNVMQYKYDMLGNHVYQNGMDAGQRWLLLNILGMPLRTWDERDHELQYFYDALHRPVYSKVLNGDGNSPLNNIFDRVMYGEDLLLPGRANEAALQLDNVLEKVVKHFDTAGLIRTDKYDFKGQPVASVRKLFKNYKAIVNWTDANLVTDLEADEFIFTTETDAIGRITKQTAPDGSIISPFYNEAGLLNSEAVEHINPAAATTYITDIDYNEKGQRNKIIYGNNVITKFYYDKETFRLSRLETKRQNNDPLQDWYYTYDPVGNITHIEDKNIPVTFFNNQKITGISIYTYDATYRLAEATGRENNAALNFGDCDNWSDTAFLQQLTLGDPMAVRNYTQSYQYDTAGNIVQMKHIAMGGNWTRDYEYETINNRLKNTHIGDNGNPANYTNYQHHAKHGFMEELPHLEKIGWNFKEEIILTTRQHCTADNVPVITYYQYDGQGQRIRKITENGNGGMVSPTKKEERIYISGYETYKRYQAGVVSFERESLSLLDQGHRFVMVETVKQNTSPPQDNSETIGERLVRFQLHNHLGSAALELDGTNNANVISYEEYHPFGTTAYQAINAAIKSAAKRYRYTGMERDEETGLEYHSARYYLPWLGRWLNSDPIGIQDGLNLYAYVKNNPAGRTDKKGTQASSSSPVSVTPLLPQVSPLSLSGNVTVHDPFSSSRSVSGSATLSLEARSGFILSVPPLSVKTTGFLDGTASANVDTKAGTGRLTLHGGAVLGDVSGLHLTVIGDASLKVPVPPQIQLNQAVKTFTSALPNASGDLKLQGSVGAGTFSLADFRARASVGGGKFDGSFDAKTFGNLGKLHLTASGTYNTAGGTPSLSTISATGDLKLPGVSLTAQGSGKSNADGNLAYTASANLRLLGLQSLRINGGGIISPKESSFSGTFSGPGPLYTSYITGNASLSTTRGISASAAVFGLTYSPAVSATSPTAGVPPKSAAGDAKTPWEPGGLTIGASLFRYSQGNFNYISAGFMPDLSKNFANNPRFGFTAKLSF